MQRRTLLLAGLAAAVLRPHAALAAPVRYLLAPDSTVAFTFKLAGVPSRGTMPVKSADLQLDFARVRGSRVRVVMDATKARTSLPLADSAMKGDSILATSRFPEITFDSTSVTRTDTGAAMTGDLRVRDVSRPVTLQARFFRTPDRDPQDLSQLQIELTGGLKRSAFGATGFGDVVDDEIGLSIRARIDRAG